MNRELIGAESALSPLSFFKVASERQGDQTRQTTPRAADKVPTFFMFARNTAPSICGYPCDAMGCTRD